MVKQGRAYFFSIFFAAGMSFYQSSVFGASLWELESLYEKKQYRQAYNMALMLEASFAGEPKFDFILGMSALETKRLDQAVFAFERVLMIEPSNHHARLELARAYYFLGDYVASKNEFNTVMDVNPPENVQKNIQEFLSLIAEKERKARHLIKAHAVLDVGYDTNVNSTTDQLIVDDLPNDAVLEFRQDTVAQEDTFYKLSATSSYTYLLNKKTGLFLDLSAASHDNLDTNEFDTLQLSVKAGPTFAKGSYRLKFPIQYQYLTLDSEEYRNMIMLGVEHTRLLNRKRYLMSFFQVGEMTYPDYETRDATTAVLGLAYAQSKGAQNYLVSLYGGKEDAKEDAGEHNSRDYYGLKLRVTHKFQNKHSVFLGVGAMSARYGADNPHYLKVRENDMYQLSVGWDWKYSAHWKFNISADAYDSQSNLELYDYDREVVRLSVKYQM